MNDPLLCQKRDGIAIITLNRPGARNALDPEMACRLADAIVDFASDDAMRVAIITGAGNEAFCAGTDRDLLALLAGLRQPVDEWDWRVREEPIVLAASALRGFPLYKPVIAAVNGACLGAGTEILLGTDIRICADHASYRLTEVDGALPPCSGSTLRLPRQLSYCEAMELMLTGETIDAVEACRIGLVNRIVPSAEVLPAAEAIAARIAANAPAAVQRIKETVLRSTRVALDRAYAIEEDARREARAADYAEPAPVRMGRRIA